MTDRIESTDARARIAGMAASVLASLLACLLQSGCARGETDGRRDIQQLEHDAAAPTLADTLSDRQSMLLFALEARDSTRLPRLVTADFLLVDYRSAEARRSKNMAAVQVDSLSYFMIMQGRESPIGAAPDPMQLRCHVPGNPTVSLLRLTDQTWVIGLWRRPDGQWRAYRLILTSPPRGEPPIPGAQCQQAGVTDP
jgi:hypothetical protein